MTNTGDFDPAKAVQDVRQQLDAEAVEEAKKRAEAEAAEKRTKAYAAERRANKLELLRYAEKELEKIRNPVISEFVITERWWTEEPEYISPGKKRADQEEISTISSSFLGRRKIQVATRHERQTRYQGSWLSLYTQHAVPPGSVSRQDATTHRRGWVKLSQPRAGYAYVSISGWDPRNVGAVTKEIISLSTLRRALRSGLSKEVRERANEEIKRKNPLRIYESLEEASEEALYPVEKLTREVAQALNFVKTGQSPKPKRIEPIYEPPGD